MKKNKKGKYELLKTTAALSYSDSSIAGGQNYYYKVVAYYKNGSTMINGKASYNNEKTYLWRYFT